MNSQTTKLGVIIIGLLIVSATVTACFHVLSADQFTRALEAIGALLAGWLIPSPVPHGAQAEPPQSEPKV